MKKFFVILMIAISILEIWFGNFMVSNHIFHVPVFNMYGYLLITTFCITEFIFLFFAIDFIVNGIKAIYLNITDKKIGLITIFPFVLIKKNLKWNISFNMHFSINSLILTKEYSCLKHEKFFINLYIIEYIMSVILYFVCFYFKIYLMLIFLGVISFKFSLKINYLIYKEYEQRNILANLYSSDVIKLSKLIINQINTNIQKQTLIGENLWLISYFDLLHNRCLLAENKNLYSDIIEYCSNNKDIIVLQALIEVLFSEIYNFYKIGNIDECDKIRLKFIEIEHEFEYMYVSFVKSNYEQILKRNYSKIIIRKIYSSFI